SFSCSIGVASVLVLEVRIFKKSLMRSF
ncbi:hypothetical protein X975_14447, partial [Stegodyphus mimosarum]